MYLTKSKLNSNNLINSSQLKLNSNTNQQLGEIKETFVCSPLIKPSYMIFRSTNKKVGINSELTSMTEFTQETNDTRFLINTDNKQINQEESKENNSINTNTHNNLQNKDEEKAQNLLDQKGNSILQYLQNKSRSVIYQNGDEFNMEFY
jgi:hypothetical protein